MSHNSFLGDGETHLHVLERILCFSQVCKSKSLSPLKKKKFFFFFFKLENQNKLYFISGMGKKTCWSYPVRHGDFRSQEESCIVVGKEPTRDENKRGCAEWKSFILITFEFQLVTISHICTSIMQNPIWSEWHTK